MTTKSETEDRRRRSLEEDELFVLQPVWFVVLIVALLLAIFATFL